MSGPVDFYFDFISPYAYIASTQIDALAARHGRTVTWRPVLIGVTVMKVMGIKPLMETPMKSDYLRHDAPRMAKAYGIPFKYHDVRGGNSLAASRTFLWLKNQDHELAMRFARRMFERLWVDGLDITPREDVVAEAAALGVNGHDLLVAITSPQGKQALNVAVDEAINSGVFGVPFFIADGEPIWGGDRLWMLDHWLKHGSWDGAGQAVLACVEV
jgi:2-hydroxychromene-2-carboxylate isomerase